LITSFKSIFSVLKKSRDAGEKPDATAYATAKYLLLSTTALCVSIFFLAVGYEVTISLWAGLAVSLRRTFDAQPVALESEKENEQPQDLASKQRISVPSYAKVTPPLPRRKTPTWKGGP
jgi:hypothetical protein